MFDTYSSKVELAQSDFNEIAEQYFQNYLSAWCDHNKIDDVSRKAMVTVLSDYSNFFFDALMQSTIEQHSETSELKN